MGFQDAFSACIPGQGNKLLFVAGVKHHRVAGHAVMAEAGHALIGFPESIQQSAYAFGGQPGLITYGEKEGIRSESLQRVKRQVNGV